MVSVALLVGLVYRCGAGEQRSPSWRGAFAAASLGGLACVAAVGLAAVLHQGLVVVLVLVAVTAPAVLRAVWHRGRRAEAWFRVGSGSRRPRTRGDQSGPVYVTLPARSTDPSLHHRADAAAMSNPELCRAWRRTTASLRSGTTGHDRTEQVRLVVVREHYLDELERRDPLGFRRWLAVDAGPDLDPTPYIHG